MQIVRPSQVAKEQYLSDLFTHSDVTRQPVTPGSNDYNANIIGFGKGVRNKLHTHTSEQILIVTDGKGIVTTETEQREVTTGDVVLISAGEKHWHGATADSEFAHIAITRSDSRTEQVEK